MWRTGERIQLRIGLGIVEMRSVGVLQCVSECTVTVYFTTFTGVSLSLLTVALLIYRHAEHKVCTCRHWNMYILHLQAHWTCIFVLTAHRKCTFSDEISLVYPFPLFYPYKMGEYLDKLSNHWHPGNIVYCLYLVLW